MKLLIIIAMLTPLVFLGCDSLEKEQQYNNLKLLHWAEAECDKNNRDACELARNLRNP